MEEHVKSRLVNKYGESPDIYKDGMTHDELFCQLFGKENYRI